MAVRAERGDGQLRELTEYEQHQEAHDAYLVAYFKEMHDPIHRVTSVGTRIDTSNYQSKAKSRGIRARLCGAWTPAATELPDLQQNKSAVA